jgi:hypothetical protein
VKLYSLYPHQALRPFNFQALDLHFIEMHIPKNYFHDRLVLLVLTISLFMAVAGSLLLLFQLDPSRSVYVLQYRSNLGLGSAFESNTPSGMLRFIGFFVIVLAFHVVLSMRTYHLRRKFSVAVLYMGTVLLALGILVSNALLEGPEILRFLVGGILLMLGIASLFTKD